MKKTALLADFALAATLALTALSGAALAAPPNPGDRMPDGTVYVDISLDTNKPLYTTPADAPGLYALDKAEDYCGALNAFGHTDWRVSTKDELDMEFNSRAAIGGFNETGSNPAGFYWSSLKLEYNLAWAQRFSDGFQIYGHRETTMALRCVR